MLLVIKLYCHIKLHHNKCMNVCERIEVVETKKEGSLHYPDVLRIVGVIGRNLRKKNQSKLKTCLERLHGQKSHSDDSHCVFM